MALDEALAKSRGDVPECVAVGYVDMSTGMLLGVATVDSHPQEVLDLVAAATADLFVQTIYDIEVDAMAFGRVCLLGDAAFAVRPHAAAGTAKAADDGWALTAALDRHADLASALSSWEESQLRVGAQLLERTRTVGSDSQVTNTWKPGDPDLIFGLHAPGDGETT